MLAQNIEHIGERHGVLEPIEETSVRAITFAEASYGQPGRELSVRDSLNVSSLFSVPSRNYTESTVEAEQLSPAGLVDTGYKNSKRPFKQPTKPNYLAD
jgi:hypothetical protein